jgi:hypothetical protein
VADAQQLVVLFRQHLCCLQAAACSLEAAAIFCDPHSLQFAWMFTATQQLYVLCSIAAASAATAT